MVGKRFKNKLSMLCNLNPSAAHLASASVSALAFSLASCHSLPSLFNLSTTFCLLPHFFPSFLLYYAISYYFTSVWLRLAIKKSTQRKKSFIFILFLRLILFYSSEHELAEAPPVSFFFFLLRGFGAFSVRGSPYRVEYVVFMKGLPTF